MIRRPGMSITEVLVALFVMALGLIGLLTMFPLGALQIGQALKDDRTAQCASQADGYMRWYWKAYVVESNGDPLLTSAFDSPGIPPGSPAPPPLPPALPNANPGEPSYPVFVDPIGVDARSGFSQSWVAANTAGPPPGPPWIGRRTLGQLPPWPAALRVCSLMDGFGFDARANGQPTDMSTGLVDRDYRYNWLWVLQRPDNAVRNVATMTVVVFDKRAPRYTYNGDEYAYSATFTPGTTTISVPQVNGITLQKGGWVMDGTSNGSMRHAIFYRIVSATPNPLTPGLLDLELQSPIRRLDGGSGPYNGTLIVLAGVSEVFERPELTTSEQ